MQPESIIFAHLIAQLIFVYISWRIGNMLITVAIIVLFLASGILGLEVIENL